MVYVVVSLCVNSSNDFPAHAHMRLWLLPALTGATVVEEVFKEADELAQRLRLDDDTFFQAHAKRFQMEFIPADREVGEVPDLTLPGYSMGSADDFKFNPTDLLFVRDRGHEAALKPPRKRKEVDDLPVALFIRGTRVLQDEQYVVIPKGASCLVSKEELYGFYEGDRVKPLGRPEVTVRFVRRGQKARTSESGIFRVVDTRELQCECSQISSLAHLHENYRPLVLQCDMGVAVSFLQAEGAYSASRQLSMDKLSRLARKKSKEKTPPVAKKQKPVTPPKQPDTDARRPASRKEASAGQQGLKRLQEAKAEQEKIRQEFDKEAKLEAEKQKKVEPKQVAKLEERKFQRVADAAKAQLRIKEDDIRKIRRDDSTDDPVDKHMNQLYDSKLVEMTGLPRDRETSDPDVKRNMDIYSGLLRELYAEPRCQANNFAGMKHVIRTLRAALLQGPLPNAKSKYQDFLG